MIEYLIVYLMVGWLVTVATEFVVERTNPGIEMIYRRSVLLWPVLLIGLLVMLVFWMLEHGLDD